MKKILIVFTGALLFSSIASAQVETTTTVTNAPTQGQATTTVTTVTKDVTVPTPADEKITSAVYDKFSKAPALIGTNLTVTCLNGVVTISGVVTAQSQADAAIEAAKSVPGASDIRSNIKVTTNPDLNRAAPVVPKY